MVIRGDIRYEIDAAGQRWFVSLKQQKITGAEISLSQNSEEISQKSDYYDCGQGSRKHDQKQFQ